MVVKGLIGRCKGIVTPIKGPTEMKLLNKGRQKIEEKFISLGVFGGSAL